MWTVIFLISTAYSVYYSRKLKEVAKNKNEELKSDEILHVIIPEVFSPVLSGAVYYYSWNKDFPKRAKQANKYSWIIFGALILIGVVWSSIGGQY